MMPRNRDPDQHAAARPAGQARRSGARALVLACVLAIAACTTAPPEGISPVASFELDRYLGRWYEIARLDHSFERGLSDVSATYRLRDDGEVAVINRGYDAERGEWREASGRASFTGSADRGSLKVTFFWPFYGGYHVVALDRDDYRWAMVVGPSRDYLWILSRETTIAPELRQRLLSRAFELGIGLDGLIWVEHGRSR